MAQLQSHLALPWQPQPGRAPHIPPPRPPAHAPPPLRDANEIELGSESDSSHSPSKSERATSLLDEALWWRVQPRAPPDGCAAHAALWARARGWGHTSVLFLGTGSAEPQKYRGATGVLLQVVRGRG